jgi:hypothetical protein
MSKAEIVQRLIEGNHITIKEAVVLLSENTHYYSPNSTKNPYDPPFEITCNTKIFSLYHD